MPHAAASSESGAISSSATGEPPLDSTQVRYAYTDRLRFRSDKATRELGYTVSPLEPALRDAIAWFRGHGML